MNRPMPDRPRRQVRLGPTDVTLERRAGGVIHLRSPHALEPYPRHLLERLEHWAARTPERPLLAQRDRHGGWRTLSYRDALAKVRRVGQYLLDKELSSERPLAVLS